MKQSRSIADTVVVLLVTVLTVGDTTSALGIKLENNKYTGLVIGVHRSVPQNDSLVQAIKDAFIRASRALFLATDNRAYFANITILLPRTWNGTDYPAATDETFCRAAVRVDRANPVYGNTPYVKRAEGCGKPGEYLHLTPGFLTDPNVTRNYGPIVELGGEELLQPRREPAQTTIDLRTPGYARVEAGCLMGGGRWGRVLVHEWGHLRWGLFDEYASGDNAF
ncbi:hypothetical protein Bbelb_103590 [Branchiostoma belcheri]|nr:hypothetical protein Bbelb_103590 [Branchiostoma belcheri]